MTVNTTSITPLIYTGTGTTDTYAYNFTIYEASDLVVERVTIATGVKETLTLDAVTDGYEVEVDGNGDFTGNIILSDGNLPDTQKIVIYPQYPIDQQDDYTAFGPLPSETLERRFDKLTYICQQLKEEIDRCLKVSIESGSEATSDALIDDINDAVAAAVAAQSAAETAQSGSETAETNAQTAQTAAEAAQAAAEAAVDEIKAEIHDADEDTKIEVEQSADEDKIKMTTAGVLLFELGSDGHMYLGDDTVTPEFILKGATRDWRVVNDGNDLLIRAVGSATQYFDIPFSTSDLSKIFSAHGIQIGASGGGGTPESNTLYKANIIKAWVKISYAGGTPSIENSFNVSSITDQGVGQVDINFDVPFADANYVIMPGGQQGGTVCNFETSWLSAGSARLSCYDTADSIVDPNIISAGFIGDQ